MTNPFTIYQYEGPQYFCNREAELTRLIEAFDNRRYLLLYSMRRLGKSGLIHHFHNHLKQRKKVVCIYCDIQNTSSDQEFVTKLITSCLSALEKSKKGILSRVGKFFSSLRPVVSFDPMTSMPTVEIQIRDVQQVQSSMDALMTMLGGLDQKVQITIDEFQQISQYEVPSMMDATLRGYLQKIPNTQFIFCGSQQHLLLSLFTDVKKPFFSAVDHLILKPLDRQVYNEFIQKHFRKSKQKISIEYIELILDWTRGHTYHSQYFCNRLFAQKHLEIDLREIEEIKSEILYTYEQSYLQFRAILSKNQWKCLLGIAKEQKVDSVTGKDFLQKYDLAQSSAHQAVKVLLEKELIYEQQDLNGSTIFVQDPFFSRWLEKIN